MGLSTVSETVDENEANAQKKEEKETEIVISDGEWVKTLVQSNINSVFDLIPIKSSFHAL